MPIEKLYGQFTHYLLSIKGLPGYLGKWGMTRWYFEVLQIHINTCRVGTTLTWFEECGQAKVDSHKGSIIILIEEKEILRLKVSMHDTIRMACANDLYNSLTGSRCRILWVFTPRNDPVEEFTSRAKLQDQMHRMSILIGSHELDNVRWLPRNGFEDLNLGSDIFDIFSACETSLRDGFACEDLSRRFVRTHPRDSELTSAQFFAECVDFSDVLHGPIQHGSLSVRRMIGLVMWDCSMTRFRVSLWIATFWWWCVPVLKLSCGVIPHYWWWWMRWRYKKNVIC